MDKPVIFISYSHKDEPDKPRPDETAWLTYVQSFLYPVVKQGIFDIWVDRHIPGGDVLDEEIKKKLAICDIFLLLVSRHSLASTYIVDTEIATLRRRKADGEDVHMYPIVLSPIPRVALAQLMDLNLRPPDAMPLAGFASYDRDVVMAKIADEIADQAKQIADRKRHKIERRLQQKSTYEVVTVTNIPDAGISDLQANFTADDNFEILEKIKQGDGSWTLKFSMRQNELRPSPDRPAQGPKHIFISHLPETAYENLVGRDAELQRLDDAWADKTTNIISLVAEGGAGKSALVNEWLKRLQADSYRGAEAVLGWSFYSQGSKERATAADEFLNWALEKLGITLETTSASAKGEAIAEAMGKRRVLLVLDGVEPLQHGPGPQVGQLKDLGLRALLRRFAAVPPAEAHGLVVLTSRLAVKDVARWNDVAAPVVDVEQLSEEAGAALLRDNGVWGTDKELKAASRDFGGHPLALGLLASFLKETQKGDVRRRDHIRDLLHDEDNPRHDHAKRVMASYEKEWLVGKPELLAMMHMVGLFDRPASGDCLRALRKKPTIPGLTDAIVDLKEGEWQRAIACLREVRLLAPPDPLAPDELDAHPLVREWFGERLKQRNETAWEAAHSRLYDHLRRTTREGESPTLEKLAPLYQAIAHGCRAGRHQEALDGLLFARISRRNENYSNHKLGAFGSNLAALSLFFEKPYDTPVVALTKAAQAWVLNGAAICLRALGRFGEALPAARAGLRGDECRSDWSNAALSASNLAETELLTGEFAAAVVTAEQSVVYADRSGNKSPIVINRATHADALHAGGRREEAARVFADAEQRLINYDPERPLLPSLPGYAYCDLLLAKNDHVGARDRAMQTLKWGKRYYSLLSQALDVLTLGRAHFGLALGAIEPQTTAAAALDEVLTARARVDEAVDGLRNARARHHLPRGLLARAAFRRSVGDWDGAARDLEEVEEIAEPGPMRLFLCDMALERARLAFAQIEAFAPLHGMLEKDNPAKPEVLGAAEIARLKGEAAKEIKIAADYIATCGYHRRDEELAELQAVLAGGRKFADLPPRV